MTLPVATDETAMVSFAATIIRTASVSGMVTLDGEAMKDVEVTLSGEHAPAADSTMTGDDGSYSFGGLRKGDYTVTMTNPDDNAYSFPTVAQSVNLSVGQAQSGVSFAGARLRQASISGQVAVDGTPIPGVTVMLSGDESGEDTTDANGEYRFTRLVAGDYTLTISGYDTVEYAFEPTRDLTLALDESSIQNFTGRSLRTATVMGYVTVEDAPLPGIGVTLSANSGEILGAMPTGADGGYAFVDLLAGVYRVDITGYDDEHDFAATTWTGPVATDSTAIASFEATIIRTASVSGMVTVDGEAMKDVEVTLTGEHAPAADSMMTGDDGSYSFGGLRKGDYTVTMTNPDADRYDFPTVAQSVNLSVGQAQSGVSFAGARLRQASISGQVAVEGTPIADVTVMLSGDESDEEMTDANGEYNFPGLAGGSYMVTITNPDTAAYEFEVTEFEVALAEDAAHIQDFVGMHTRTASVSGYLYLDEGPTDEMYNEGEPKLELPGYGVPLLLQGPGIDIETPGKSDSTGAYSFGGLQAGLYRVLVAMNDTVADTLTAAGYRFAGEQTGQAVNVAAAGNAMVNLPFRITTQTIFVGAVMGKDTTTGDAVGGVVLELYPTAEDLVGGTKMLDKATTDTLGHAKFDFPRAKDLGPGGQGLDHLVFVKVAASGHTDLVVTDNVRIEIEYEQIDRVSWATTEVRLLNQAANFQWWIKSDADAKDGDKGLADWQVVIGTDTITTGADGKATYSGTVALGATPAKYTIMADTTQADSLTMGEKWMQSEALVYTHNPMALPAMNSAEMNDLDTVYVTFTTQTLTLGVYREADDVEGYTNYRSGLPRGDHRPAEKVAKEMSIELLKRDHRNRLRQYEWDCDPTTEKCKKKGIAKVGADGMVSFTGIPAAAELTVRFLLGSSDRIQTDHGYDEIETFGDELNIGPTLGAFGEMSGAGPEVRICFASDPTRDDPTSDDWCATFGYQWKTGKVSGNVGTESGHKVVIEATGQTWDSMTVTKKDGDYSFTGLQDGVYTATAANAGDYTVNGAPTQEGLVVYHDEYEDDDDAMTTYVGTAGADTATWTTTRGGLSIKGYVGNDGLRGDSLLRGDESKAGITITLKDGTTAVATAQTDASGLYSFAALAEGSYTVSAG